MRNFWRWGTGSVATAFIMLTGLHCSIEDPGSPNTPGDGAAGESSSGGAADGTPINNEAGAGGSLGGAPTDGETTGGADTTTAGAGGEGPVPVAGDHYGYVFDTLKMPVTGNEATMVGFDLDGDGVVDNRFGKAMATLTSGGFDINGSIATAIDEGTTIMLGDLQATSLTTAKGAAFATYFGADPMPAACAAADDCGHHLTGMASFSLASSPVGKACEGALTDGVFTCKGGALPISILLGVASLEFTLSNARVELTGVTDEAFASGRLGGTISERDVNEKIYPAELEVVTDAVSHDCTGGVAPACGCTSPSTGKTYLDLLDTSDDCAVSLAELKDSALLGSGLFSPELDLNDDGTPESLSCAISISGVHATFDLP